MPDHQMQQLQDEISELTDRRNDATKRGDEELADAIQAKINRLVAFYD